MTYCVGIKVREGLVGLADGRITSGIQLTVARKVTLLGKGQRRFMLMTSGLRSVRDKTVAYLEREMRTHGPKKGFGSMLDAVTAFTKCLRTVATEDKQALEESGLKFDLNAIIGGQLPDDPEPMLYLIYPEGNWVQADERTPYLSIGQTAYGKPILDRSLKPDISMAKALKLAYLSFDSTRFSSATVGFPIDMVTWSSAEGEWREALFADEQLRSHRQWWNEHLTKLVEDLPDGPWADSLLPGTQSAIVGGKAKTKG